jgi:hypothetical protein
MSKAFSSFLYVCILVMTVVSLYDNVQAQTAEPCTYTLFKYPGTRTTSTAANGINKYGTIVGTAQDQTGITFGFVRYSDGSFKRYAVSGSYNTEFFHRNDNGVTVGFYQSAAGGKHGLLLSGSTLSTIDYPGAIDTVLTGINKWGSIVGYYTDSTGHFKGLKRYSSGGFAKVSIPNYSDIMPMDITDSGVIVGTLGAGGPIGIHGFWLSGANWQILDDPDYPPSSTGLNALRGGVYVGQAFDSNGTGHAIQLVGNSSNSFYSNFVVPGAVESFAGDVLHGTYFNTIVGGAKISGAGDQAFIAVCQ